MKVFSSQGKFNVFIIFLILAISSSLVGKLTSTYDKDILFKLVLTDLPKDKVVYDKSHDSVMLKVRGYGFNLAKYYFETPSLNISVKKLKESNNTFLWNQKENFNDTKLSFTSSIQLLTISEESLFFYYDQYISQTKKIKPNISIDYKSGYDSFKSFSMTNDYVTILGPKDILEKIDHIDTELVRLNNVDSDIKIDLNLLKPPYDNLKFDFSSVKYELEVDQYTEEIISIPVTILGNTDLKYNFYPKELMVKYFISVENYKKTTPIDFRIECIFDKNESSDLITFNGDLKVGKSILNETFSSHVSYHKETDKIIVTNLDGPLKHLKNEWHFKEINNNTQLEFFIDFELKNPILNGIMKKSFELGLNKIAKAFEERAVQLYK